MAQRISDGDAEAVTVTDTEAKELRLDEGVVDREIEAAGETEPVGEPVAETEPLPESEGVREGVGDADDVPLGVGDTENLADEVPERDGATLLLGRGDTLPERELEIEVVGERLLEAEDVPVMVRMSEGSLRGERVQVAVRKGCVAATQ